MARPGRLPVRRAAILLNASKQAEKSRALEPLAQIVAPNDISGARWACRITHDRRTRTALISMRMRRMNAIVADGREAAPGWVEQRRVATGAGGI